MAIKKNKTALQTVDQSTTTDTASTLPTPLDQAQPVQERPQTAKPFVRRENYCKFNMVEFSLGHMLERSVPIKEITANLGISLPTFYKYKNLLSAKNNRLYVSPEEEAFLKRR